MNTKVSPLTPCPTHTAGAQDWRSWWKITNSQFSLEERNLQSKILVEFLHSWPLLQSATRVAAFWPLRSEVQIQPLLYELAERGALLLPKILDGGKLIFCSVRNPDSDLVPGPLGLREPKAELENSLAAHTALTLVPGLLFGQNGERIGRGAGFYDRHLAANPGAVRVGLAYDWQVQNYLPQHNCDIPMHYVITPNTIQKGGIL